MIANNFHFSKFGTRPQICSIIPYVTGCKPTIATPLPAEFWWFSLQCFSSSQFASIIWEGITYSLSFILFFSYSRHFLFLIQTTNLNKFKVLTSCFFYLGGSVPRKSFGNSHLKRSKVNVKDSPSQGKQNPYGQSRKYPLVSIQYLLKDKQELLSSLK